jgi:hypothetical protein
LANLPTHVTEIIDRVSGEHPDDIPAAVEAAEREIRELPDYDDVVGALLRSAVREAVYDARHKVNVAVKRRAGYYGQPSTPREGERLRSVYDNVFAYHIAGTTLGELRGIDLGTVAEQERAISAGHLFNAELLEWCASHGVTGERRVREVISEDLLRRAFRRLWRKYHGGRAA